MSDPKTWPRGKMYEIEHLEKNRLLIRMAVNCDYPPSLDDAQAWEDAIASTPWVGVDFNANRSIGTVWLKRVYRYSLQVKNSGGRLILIGLSGLGLEKADELQLRDLERANTIEEALGA